jgi:hypothetical protein
MIVEKMWEYVDKVYNKRLARRVKKQYYSSMIEESNKNRRELQVDQPEEITRTSKTPIDYIEVKRRLIAENIVIDNVINQLVKDGKTYKEICKFLKDSL